MAKLLVALALVVFLIVVSARAGLAWWYIGVVAALIIVLVGYVDRRGPARR